MSLGKPEIKLHKDTLELFSKLVKLIEMMNHFYYNYSEQTYTENRKLRREVIYEAYEKLKSSSFEDVMVINYIISVATNIFEIQKAIMAVRL